MRPIPVAFHIWFVEIHTYGIGLALTFWFGLRYTERRLRDAGHPWQWVTGMFISVIVAAIVGARALHVLSNLSYYSSHPGQVVAVWQGGLSSFGGILFAVPVAIVAQRHRCPSLPTLRFADLMAPVLMASWGIGRLLGPQLMVAGGGHVTHQWFGMYYAGQAGKRLPVPVFQALEDFAIFGLLLLVERWLRSLAPPTGAETGPDGLLAQFPAAATVEPTGRGGRLATAGAGVGGSRSHSDRSAFGTAEATDSSSEESGPEDGSGTGAPATAGLATAGLATAGLATAGPAATGPAAPSTPLPPAGIVLGAGMVLWGVERFADERLWLGEDGHLGSLLVQGAGILLAVSGAALLASRVAALRRWHRGKPPASEADGCDTAAHPPLAGDERGLATEEIGAEPTADARVGPAG